MSDEVTLNHLFLQRVEQGATRTAMRRKVEGTWEDITWQGYFDAARKIGLGLKALGVGPGDPVGLLSNTRAEWAFCDMAILGVRGITVPIYQSNLPEEVKYIVDNAEIKVLILEDLDQWKKVHDRLDDMPSIQHVVIMETDATQATQPQDAPTEGVEKLLTLDALIEKGEAEDPQVFTDLMQQAKLDDAVTFIYTSGTTGHPKGVILTHGNGMAECNAIGGATEVNENDVTLAFLPLAHVFARALHWTQLQVGNVTAFAEEITKVVDNMGEVRPTFFAAVPRIYEKIHQAVMAKINANTGFKKKFALFGLRAAMERQQRIAEGQGVGIGLAMRCTLGAPALKKVKAGLHERTGGKVRFFVSGGAPLSREIAYFLSALDFNIWEGYGLTETTAATHINREGACKLGTVGRTVAGAECKIAEDGEVLLKGGMVMKGYHKRPDATAEVLKEGWFHTGDIGEIDSEGYLRITDRKKDLIITAAGKNIAPQNVENHVKTHPLVSQVALFGDKRKFCVALLTVDEEAARKELSDANTPLAELVKNPQLKAKVQAAIDEKNADLPSYETIKYFEILPKDFEVGEELTPTLKVKRRVVSQKYGDLVEKLYEGK